MTDAHVFQKIDMPEASHLELGDLEAVVCTSAKPGRDGPNEDAAAVIALGAGAAVAVISDGAGGHPDGAEAAALAVAAVCDAVTRIGDDVQSLRGAIINGFESADRAIHGLGSGAAATLVVAEIQQGMMRAYHAGDSMVLVTGQRGRIKWQNIPHSPVGYAVEAGLLDRAEALHHEDLHLVSNLLGLQDMRIELGPPIGLSKRDTILLASDGLSDNLHFEEIVERVRKGPLVRAGNALAALGKERMGSTPQGAPSKPDDLTLIILRRRAEKRRSSPPE